MSHKACELEAQQQYKAWSKRKCKLASKARRVLCLQLLHSKQVYTRTSSGAELLMVISARVDQIDMAFLCVVWDLEQRLRWAHVQTRCQPKLKGLSLHFWNDSDFSDMNTHLFDRLSDDGYKKEDWQKHLQ